MLGGTPTVPGWAKSSKSGPNCDNCVEASEVAVPGQVAIRDTKNRAGGMLTVEPAAFSRFVAAAARGQLVAV